MCVVKLNYRERNDLPMTALIVFLDGRIWKERKWEKTGHLFSGLALYNAITFHDGRKKITALYYYVV